MRITLGGYIVLWATLTPAAFGSTPGSGAPTANGAAGFLNAWYRGNFAQVTLPPTSDVIPFGTGLLQEFPARTPAFKNATYALVKPDPNAAPSPTDTLQVFADIYAVYTTLGVGNAGFPTTDTTPCPANAAGTCEYQLFTKNYGIFAYSAPSSVTYTLKDPFYTEWVAQGGTAGSLGVLTSGAIAVTSPSKLTGNQQSFANGAIFSYSTTSTTGTVAEIFSVSGTIFTAYVAAGGLPVLGFATSEEILLASGLHRQTFENGRIEWSATNPAQVLFPVSEVDIQGAAAGLSLNLGDTVTLSASALDSNGAVATGRSLTWTTSNGQALSVQGNGYTAVVKALSKGVAQVTATSEGKTSAPILIRVASPCCDIGEGAPTAAITLAFQTAVSRNRLNLSLPNPTPVTRAAGGYIQQFNNSSGAVVLICESDNSQVAYALSGSLYTAFVANGGFAGALGYPASDVSSLGTQVFESGAALAGATPVLVPAAVRTKWAALGSETGQAGLPTSAATAFQSSAGTAGMAQSFADGNIYVTAAGAGYFSTGLILARYVALMGPTGVLGAPASDVVSASGVARENFENGYIDQQAGAAAAVEHVNPRKPSLSAAPSRVIPGGKVHLSISGFSPGSTLLVSQTGQADFRVLVANGTYSWDNVVPAAAISGSITAQAKDANGTDIASASYAVVTIPQLAPSFTVVSGDAQSGTPGALLPLPLVAVLKDLSGKPLAGVPIFASASPGASVQAASATDANGLATATLRLPTSGLGIASLTAGGKVVSFSAHALGSAISGFPVLSQQDTTTFIGGRSQTLAQKGSLTTALAGLIRYYQNLGKLGSPNGLATPQSLNQFLTTNSGYSASETGDLIANPWLATAFAGVRGGVVVESATQNRLYDLLANGTPALIGLSLTSGTAPVGMTFVVATGVGDDGTVQISDSAMGRASLSDYMNGFGSASGTITGAISILLQFAPTQTTPSGFVVASPISAGALIFGVSGNCSPALNLSDIAVPGATVNPASVGGVRFLACDGTQSAYQASFQARLTAAGLDLASALTQPIPTKSALSFAVTRSPASGLVFSPQSLAVTSVVNSASFTPSIAPGGLASVFGAGLTSGGADTTTVTVGGISSYVYASSPFQVNFQIPSAIAPSQVPAVISGLLGSVTQSITIIPVAPAVFTIGVATDGGALGAAINQDGSLNSGSNPAMRGSYLSLYGTGLGAKVSQGGYQVAQIPVTVLLGGATISPSYAGISPGLIGVDQINFQVPASAPPSLGAKVALQQGSVTSAAVQIAIQ